MCQQCMKLDLLHVKWHAWLMICGADSEAWVSPWVFIWQQCHRARVSNILYPLLFVSLRFPAPLQGYEDALLKLEVVLSFDVGGNGLMVAGTFLSGAQMTVWGFSFQISFSPSVPKKKGMLFWDSVLLSVSFVQNLFIHLFILVLWFQPRVLDMLGKCPTTEHTTACLWQETMVHEAERRFHSFLQIVMLE